MLLRILPKKQKLGIASGKFSRDEFYCEVEKICGTKSYDTIKDIDLLNSVLDFIDSKLQ